MEILKFDPSEQRDIAVDLGVVPPPMLHDFNAMKFEAKEAPY